MHAVAAAILSAGLVVGFTTPLSGGLALADLADPVDGIWALARSAESLPDGTLDLPDLERSVEVAWDERGVPHIFAESNADAIRAFGYVVAHDRLFQMDFLRRVTAGRLAEVLGPDLVDTDRFLRDTGMARAVAENVDAMRAEDRIDLQAATWFSQGVNTYLDQLDDALLPLEFRLLGYRPEAWRPEDAFLVGWNLMFDLTYQREGALNAERLREALPPGAFDQLFREDEPLSVPIIRDEDRHWTPRFAAADMPGSGLAAVPGPAPAETQRDGVSGIPALEGYLDGKGSNNWAVFGERSATGAPIVAGDMHLGLNLPAIWYEVHLVTPEMDTYGVTVPGVPIPIEAFNKHVGWAFTNTGSDQIDHLRLDLNEEGTHYRYEGDWRALEMVTDTIRVHGAEPIAHTTRWSHWGPLSTAGDAVIATKWTGHSRIRTFEAIWRMNHARTYQEFEDALRVWDVPMQNILVGTRDTVAIRSTGYLPIRADWSGYGVRDGGSAASEWIGRVPFDELPHAINPDRGFLTSTNQRPAPLDYPHYLGRNWQPVFRSRRINQLLSSRDTHDVGEVGSYQADVHAAQMDLYRPLLADLAGLSPEAAALRDVLVAWDGDTHVDLREPVLFSVWDGLLHRLAWDEEPFRIQRPRRARLYELLAQQPNSPWLDVVETDEVEDAAGLLRASLQAAADSMDLTGPTWGEVHGLLVRHITGSAALRPLWRGPLPYPGFSETLSPGAGRRVTHSASWRVVLDFQGPRIVATGIYPGGQSGNPFSDRYDGFLQDFVEFRRYDLHTPEAPDDLDTPLARLTINP